MHTVQSYPNWLRCKHDNKRLYCHHRAQYAGPHANGTIAYRGVARVSVHSAPHQPHLSIPPRVYSDRHAVNNDFRMSFTRFHVPGHNLAMESGWWNKRESGHLPVDPRLYLCVWGFPTGCQVVEFYPISNSVKWNYTLQGTENLFKGKYDIVLLCNVSKILNTYRWNYWNFS